MTQYTLSFEPALPERFATLRAYIAHRSAVVEKPMKAVAADMDIAPSTLSRKLNPTDGDTQRLNVDDLAAKYLDSDTARHRRVVATAETLLVELAKVLPQLKAAAA